MGKYDGYLICTDYDGTLFYKGAIAENNIEKIKEFTSDGGLFTIASGRFAENIVERCSNVCINTYVIGLNGAVIYDPKEKKYLYKAVFPDDALDIAVKIFLENPIIDGIGVHSFEECRNYDRGNYREAYKINEISKIIFYASNENSDNAKETITHLVDERFVIERSWINGIEMLRRDSTKGMTVKRMADMLGDKARTIICAGDYENDIEMLKMADIGYAVSNALPAVKESADRITVHVKDGAIAHMIEDI